MALASYDKTLLVLPCNGANGSTIFTDYSAEKKTLTPTNVTISTAQQRYGTGSAYFNGSNAYLASNRAEDFAFGTGDFGIEFDFRPASVSADQVLFDGRPASTNGVYPTLYIKSNGQLGYNVSSSDRIAGGSLSANAWTRAGLFRISGVTKLFIDGTQIGSSYTDTNTYLAGLCIFGRGSFSSLYYGGYLANIVIHKGYGAQSANYTPGESVVKTLAGNVKDDANGNAIRDVIAYPRGLAIRGYKTQSASDGSWSLLVPDTEHNVICLDDAAGTTHNDLIHRATPL